MKSKGRKRRAEENSADDDSLPNESKQPASHRNGCVVQLKVQEEQLVAECDTWGLLGALATSNASRTPSQVPLSTDKALLITAVDAERVLSSQGAASGPLSQCTTPCSTTQPPPEVLAVVHTLREACQPGNAADDSCITEACKTLHEKRLRVSPVVTSALAARLGKASNWNALKQLHRSQPLLSLLQCPHLLSQCVAAGEFGLACHLLHRADEASHDDLAMALQILLLPVADSPASVAAEAFQRRLRSSARQRLSTAEASLSTSAIHAAAYAAAAVEGFSAYQLPLHPFVAWQQDERAIGSVCGSLSSRAAARLLKYLGFQEAAELLQRSCKTVAACQALRGLLAQALETPMGDCSVPSDDGWRTELLLNPLLCARQL